MKRTLAALLFVIPMTAAPPTFDAARILSSSGGDVVVADFTGDGKLDILASAVILLRGHGDGQFDDAMTVINLWSLFHLVSAAADFNHDGLPDVAVASANYGNTSFKIYIALNQGGGVFGTPQLLQTGGTLSDWMQAADFNHDGKPDFAMGYRSGILVFLGNGDGTFQPAINIPTAQQLVSGHAADLNNDGIPDLVATAYKSYSSSGVVVMLGNGDGTFGPVNAFYTGPGPANNAGGAIEATDGIVSGDFNHDGKMDLAVTLRNYYSIAILRGNGDGTFQLPFYVQPRGIPLTLKAVDMNNDGTTDLLVGMQGSYGFSVLLASGGTFLPAISSVLFDATTSVGAADFDNDGNLDVVGSRTPPAYTRSVAGGMAIAFAKGGGVFRTAPLLPTGGQYAQAVAIGDLNHDGKNDIVVANRNNTVSVLLATGGGNFASPQLLAVGGGPGWVEIADFNHDGHKDLVVGCTTVNYIAILFGNGAGTFQPPQYVPVGSRVGQPAIADFNGDGNPDLALGSTDSMGWSVLLLGNADGTFQPAMPIAQAAELYATYSNADATPDLIVLSNAPQSYIASLTGNGNGSFTTQQLLDEDHFSMAVGDFDGDGKVDFAQSYTALVVSRGNGDGTFQTRMTALPFEVARVHAAADLNGDGKLDLIGAGRESHYSGLQIIAGRGMAMFDAPFGYAVGWPSGYADINFAGGAAFRPFAVGDIDGDGKPDIVHVGASDGVVFLRNTTP